ncbi:hypothetical protein ACFFTN_27590 [Aminobacter aganoensis]|uniref:Uncharacterized protein n=1 Tax=Aminobacter aganoensis TaxID=83264 RepID=A0A7X0KP08_9HYPH|nr:hypothetical protein [Aminobacter aganoensis]MBB6357659.1 hypothetical protein [Aminobacter aganoensis]
MEFADMPKQASETVMNTLKAGSSPQGRAQSDGVATERKRDLVDCGPEGHGAMPT